MIDLSTLSKAVLLVSFIVFIFCLLQYISISRMNDEPEAARNGDTSDTEDLLMSDLEDSPTAEKDIVLSIDYNARIVSQEDNCCYTERDDCDTQCIEKNIRFNMRQISENKRDTSTEDLNVSDEEEQRHKPLKLQCLNLDGTASIGAKTYPDSTSTLSYSSTVFKEAYATEFISDDECGGKLDGSLHKFNSALTVEDLTNGIKIASSDMLQSTQKPLNMFNVRNTFSNSLLIDGSNLIDLWEKPQSPLMTCLEFLNDEHSDENNTDAEDMSIGSLDEHKPESLENLWEGNLQDNDNGMLYPGDRRRSSAVLTEDETFCMDSSCNPGKKRVKKGTFMIVAKQESSHDSFTDEEIIDDENKEWTETDDSGGVRQITQIKTETSIKLEGEGAVRSLRKVPKKEPSDERKSSTDSEQEDLSFSEKKSMFQRLSITLDTLPKGNKWTTEVNMDELPMAHGEIIHEQISFEDKLKMFEPDESNRKKIQKRDKSDQPTVYKYDFTKSSKEKPNASEVVVSELEKAEEIVKQVTEELIMEEDSLNEPNFDLSEGVHSRSEQDSAFTLERVEQEVSSLLAEVDKEERELSNDIRRMSCTRTDSDKSSNINSRIFDMESEKGNGSSDYAALSPDIVQGSLTTTESHLTYSEVDVMMQDGEKVTVFESKSVKKTSFDEDQLVEMTSEVDAEEYVTTVQAEPIVESPLYACHEQTQEPTFEIGSEGIAVYTITEETTGKKLSSDLLKRDEFKEALKLDEDESEVESVSHAERPSMLLDISSSVNSHIKSEILREEIDQSIEESPLEVKQIVEDLESISSSENHKRNVYKHIRTEIFTQVLSEDIESGSPEKKELSVLSPTEKTNLSEHEQEEYAQVEMLQCENGAPVADKQELSNELALDQTHDESDASDVKSDYDDENRFHKQLSPQISQESVGQTDEISSEGVVVEPDEQMVDYDEAFGEHSLTEQLKALASDSVHPGFDASNLEISDFDTDHKSTAMSSSMSDLEIHRRAKELYSSSRHEKKEIRSLKSTKQVSTIEEHSSIESCDSPQDFLLHDSSENRTVSETSEKETKSNIEDKQETISFPISSSSIKFDSSDSKDEKDNSLDEKSLDAEVSDKIDIAFKVSGDTSEKSEKLSRSDSKSSQDKKIDSDAEGSKAEIITKRKEESCSSSGETESPYYSVETSDSGRTPRSTPAASRPCSSEYDINVFSGQGSEYETCVTSQEVSGDGTGSYVTAISSQEISYATACSSFSHSSRKSDYSADSESSGHLASIEASSEASETLVPSAQEMECEFGPDFEMPVLDEEPSNEDGVREPYDMDIPESVIRSGIEMPFMKSWGFKESGADDNNDEQLSQQWSWQYAAESEVLDKFEVLECSSNLDEEQKFSNLPTANIQTVEECSSHVTTVIDIARSFTPAETISSVRESTGHRRTCSSVFDIVPERENVEQTFTIEEEQLSVSESSATHSEQTWQTNSIDTAVQLSSQAPASCVVNESSSLFSASDSFHETPPEKELTSEQSIGLQPDSYLQLNGPVEVEYNPDYDNPDVDNSELNNDQQVSHYEGDNLQFDLEIDGTFNASSNSANVPNGTSSVLNSYANNAEVGDSNDSAVPDNYAIHPSTNYESHTIGTTSDAEKPEAQQEQSQSFNYNDHRETESLVCPDLASYLPESDQCDLISAGDSLPPSYENEMNIPCSESVNSNEMPTIESHSQLLPDTQSLDSVERTDVVDTSPEDERYEYKSVIPTGNEKYYEENASSLKSEADILAESDYIPPSYGSTYDEPPSSELYTHHEEEEFEFRESDVDPSPNPSIDDKHSTPSSDAMFGRKYFPRSGDTSAASSLQEFERLESDIAAGRLSRSSIDSNERAITTKSTEHDDVSMSSLNEFEKLEKDMLDNESGDKILEEMMLSEIEEGIESQCSDILEVLPESLHESEYSEYERRRLEMEEVIKVAQSNVEKFQEETLSDAITSDDCTILMRVLSEAQDTSDGTKEASSKDDCTMDIDDSEALPNTLEADTVDGQDSSSSGEKNYGKGDCMVSSTDSIEPSSSTATHATYQFDTDSVMSSSINSAQASGEECTMVSSTDTLEPEPKLTYSQGEYFEDRTDPSGYKKESFACKLDELKRLETSNGAKEQMEMFLSKLTDESALIDDFPPHSFSDMVDDSEQQHDELPKSCEADQGFSLSGS